MDSKVDQLNSLVELLVARFDQGGGTNYINEAILLDREALALCRPGYPERSVCLSLLAHHLCTRYERLGSEKDLNEAIVLNRGALALRPLGHPHRPASLSGLAHNLCARFSLHGAAEDLNDAIALDREAVALCPLGHPDRSMSLGSLASHLATQYKYFGAVEDLNEAIVLEQEALVLRPPGHPDRSRSLHCLAQHLWDRYNLLGVADDLDNAIVLDREALALRTLGHPDRSNTLNNLALHLQTRFNLLGSVEDLNEAIVLDRDALALRPPGHLYRSSSLNNLAIHLSARYERFGSVEDLSEAIVLIRDALALRPLGHPGRAMTLANLSVSLFAWYKQYGMVEDLNEATVRARDALALRSTGNPHRSISLNNLACLLSTRYSQLGSVEDLNEAIVLDREALVLRPPGHPDRGITLTNLASNLWARYNYCGVVENLDEAIMLDREAVVLCPSGSPDLAELLSNLANHLWSRCTLLGSVEDLKEAVKLDRDTLVLRPMGHPRRSESLNSLALHLWSQYSQCGAVDDLNEAIVLDRDALELRPQGHPYRPESLNNLAQHLSTRFTHLSQLKDKEELFELYVQLAHAHPMVSSTDLPAARAWIRVAEDFQHPTTLLAYKTSLRFLIHHLASLPSLPQHLTVLKRLTSSLAVDAFSACLRSHSPTDAVELLEQGRGVFWSQLIRLHSAIGDVIASGPAGKMLADEFTRLTFLIRSALDSPSPDQHDRVCNLNIELQKIINKIRNLSGLERFLLPSLFSHLKQAASGGPVIIVNASEYSCDALVVLFDHDPVHIPLSITKDHARELSSSLAALTARTKLMDVTRNLCFLLRKLWDMVVSPIVDFLQIICPSQSRIWWCPTAEFSLLPLHAAGPYRNGQQNLNDLYISSYTPTLATLVRARRQHPPRPAPREKRFIAVGQATPAGEGELFSVGAELTTIGHHVDRLASFTRIEGTESSITRVTRELGGNEWVHFACHGIPNRKQPFESAFALHDGHFTIQQIIRCELEDPQFAYLSACHTTVGDEESPDEVIHLASAMQFVGFRSVIGTMWAVDDEWTNEITSVFYENMKDECGCLDHARAALALNKTMKTVDVPFDQRILYIHFGA